MNKNFVFIVAFGILTSHTASSTAQAVTAPTEQSGESANSKTPPEDQPTWTDGPAKVNILTNATIDLPKGYAYLDDPNTQKLLKITGNLVEPGYNAITDAEFSWWSVFSFEPAGYVKDDETIDPDAILKTLQEEQIEVNKARKEAGLDNLYLDGWTVAPHYDKQTH